MSAQNPGEGDPVKQPQLGNIVNSALSEMGTVLDEIVINVQKGADKLASDWEKNKEKSGYNHFRRGIKNWKLEGMSFTMEGGKSSPWEAPKGSRFTLWVDVTKFMIFAMDVFGPETILPGVAPDGSNTTENWFGRKKDRMIKHTYDGFRVHNPNEYSYSEDNVPFYIVHNREILFYQKVE
ncbi:hypothetical protein [Myroides sp. DW712]|uniref:hypothetical protein n=1 Tax=Myroides sp. DW712 TaxID=3389800 RepID=UPI00397D180C